MLAISVAFPCSERNFEAFVIKNGLIWICEVRCFDWTYDDKEICLLLESEVKVTPDEGEPVKFCEGDLVVFPA